MKTKRGFTLIEIVIIIMVLGILTAVTIPLVSKAINNAQIKNDKILVDNINAILSEDKIHGLPKDVNEVLWILSTSELDIDEPNYKGHSFYWYREDNSVVIYDREKETIIYPKDFTYLTIDVCKPLIEDYEETSDEGYKITYIINGKKVRFKGATTYSRENEFTLPDPSLNGYTFSGWKNNQELYGDSIKIIPKDSTGNKTFYASFTKNPESIVNIEYSITYILDGGRIENPILSYITPLNEDITLPIPTKSGYTFLGWYTTSNFEGEEIKMITAGSIGNKAFYAKWEENEAAQSYNIIYHVNGGTLINPPLKYDGTITIELPIPSKNNYDFKGWYATSNFEDGTQVTEITAGSIGDKVLYAKWEEKTPREEGVFYIFYELYGGAQTNAPEKYDGKSDVYLFTPLKRGYEFEGWYLNSGFSGDPITVIETNNYNSDITLYAKWVPIEYEIVYELNNGEWSSETLEIITTYTIEDEIVLPTPVRNGYLFGAWYKEADFSGQPVTKISVGSTGTQTLYVNWGLENFNIEYVLNGGSWHNEIVGADTYNVNIEYEFPEPIYEGFVFMGWYDNENYSGDPIEDIVLGTTGHIKLYARWVKVDHYKIDLDADGGNLAGYETTIICIEFSVGTSVELPTPTKPGYKFMGWYNGETKYESPYEYAMSIKLVARWEEEKTITE